MPTLIKEVLSHEGKLRHIASVVTKADNILLIGRGGLVPAAMGGALLFNEIAGIWALGLAAGEVKHGAIALIDPTVPVLVLAPSNDGSFDKTLSNISELDARGAQLILFSDHAGIAAASGPLILQGQLQMPEVDPFLAPLVYPTALQILAYYVAIARGGDVDKPRNLAKSVTVE